jgi:hypothetical protein
MTNRKMIDYRVRIQVAEDSPDGVLLHFLKHERHPSFSHKEMLLWALRGYWMAIAFRQRSELGNEVAEAQIQRMALDAIYQLRQQIAYIQSTFETGLVESAADAVVFSGHREKAFAKQSIAAPRSSLDWDEGEDLFDSSV